MELLNTQIENAFVSDYAVLLKKMRLLRRLNRGQASLLLDFSFKNLERLENGRVTLTEKKILNIVLALGFTMEYFNQLLRVSPLRHEMVEECQKILERLDENKLRMIMPMLQTMISSY